MDADLATRFITSLTKSLQAVIHGCLEFQKDIELGGYVYLKVDNAERIDYVLSEKMLKSDMNSMTFHSSSFHALPQPGSEGSRSSSSRDKTISTVSSDCASKSANSGHVHSRSSSESPVYSTAASSSAKTPYQNLPPSISQNSDTFTHLKGTSSNDFQISPGSVKFPSSSSNKNTSAPSSDSFRSNSRSLTDFQTAFRNPSACAGSQLPQSSQAPSWNPSHNGSTSARPSASHTSQQQQSKSGILPDPSDMEVVHIKTEEEDDVFNIPLQCSQGGSESDGLGVQGKQPWLAMRMRQPFFFPYPRLARSQSFDQRMNMARSNPRYPFFSGESSSETASLTCKVCGKGYRSRQGLLFHERAKHQNVFNVYCPVCGKGFQQTTHMYGHMATHTNIKNFQCQACGAKYAHKTSLQQHLRSGSCRASQMNSPAGLDLSTSQPFRDFTQYNTSDSQLRPSPSHSQSQSPLESTNSSLEQAEGDTSLSERRLPSFSQTNQIDNDLDGYDKFDMSPDKTGRQNMLKEDPAGNYNLASDEPVLDQEVLNYDKQPRGFSMHGVTDSGGVVFPQREESRERVRSAEVRGLNMASREGMRTSAVTSSPSPQAAGVDMTKDTQMYDTGSVASVCDDSMNRQEAGYEQDSDVPETASLSLSADDD